MNSRSLICSVACCGETSLQLFPASVVLITRDALVVLPTAYPTIELTNFTALMVKFDTGFGRLSQVVPPLVERKIVEFAPTAMIVSTLMASTALSVVVTPVFKTVQVLPPLVVLMAFPLCPTA